MDSEKGFVTPPRSIQKSHPKTSLSQAKLLTSSELKRRFAPNKKRRHQLMLSSSSSTDSLVPCERHLKMPVILDKLFTDENKENFLSRIDDNRLVPNSFLLHHSSLHSNSFKHHQQQQQQEQIFSIPDSIIKEKFKILFEKN